MLVRRIGLAVWSVLVIMCFIAARSFFSAVLLMGTVGILLFSLISVVKGKKKLQTALTVPGTVKQGAKNAISLSLKNTGAFPVFSVKGNIVCQYGEKKKDIPVVCALKPYMEQKISVPVDSGYTGPLSVTVEKLEIGDLAGVYACPVEIPDACGTTQVLPKEEEKDA